MKILLKMMSQKWNEFHIQRKKNIEFSLVLENLRRWVEYRIWRQNRLLFAHCENNTFDIFTAENVIKHMFKWQDGVCSTDSTYFERINIDTPTSEKQQTSTFPFIHTVCWFIFYPIMNLIIIFNTGRGILIT